MYFIFPNIVLCLERCNNIVNENSSPAGFSLDSENKHVGNATEND